MPLNFTNYYSSKKCEIKCPEYCKEITTQYKFFLIYAEAKCQGEAGGVGSMRTPEDNGGLKIGKILRTSFMDSP